MKSCEEVTAFINKTLNSAAIEDSSQNGLQVEGKKEIKKIVFGVSANEALFARAARAGADMIAVHHGLLWGEPLRLKGVFKKRLDILFKHNINLAAWHLPLDMHPSLGHNARLAKMLGLEKLERFGAYHGVKIGFKGVLPRALPAAKIEALFKKELSSSSRLIDFSKKPVRSVAICSGGAEAMLRQAAEEKADLFITGRSDEFVQEESRESGVRFLALGHYNSEKPGMWALMDEVKKKLKVQVEFIDIPNPL